MSQTSVFERHSPPDRDDWIVLDLVAESQHSVLGVELRGHGKDRHGVIDLVAAGPDPTPVPTQDGWDF